MYLLWRWSCTSLVPCVGDRSQSLCDAVSRARLSSVFCFQLIFVAPSDRKVVSKQKYITVTAWDLSAHKTWMCGRVTTRTTHVRLRHWDRSLASWKTCKLNPSRYRVFSALCWMTRGPTYYDCVNINPAVRCSVLDLEYLCNCCPVEPLIPWKCTVGPIIIEFHVYYINTIWHLSRNWQIPCAWQTPVVLRTVYTNLAILSEYNWTILGSLRAYSAPVDTYIFA